MNVSDYLVGKRKILDFFLIALPWRKWYCNKKGPKSLQHVRITLVLHHCAGISRLRKDVDISSRHKTDSRERKTLSIYTRGHKKPVTDLCSPRKTGAAQGLANVRTRAKCSKLQTNCKGASPRWGTEWMGKVAAGNPGWSKKEGRHLKILSSTSKTQQKVWIFYRSTLGPYQQTPKLTRQWSVIFVYYLALEFPNY